MCGGVDFSILHTTLYNTPQQITNRLWQKLTNIGKNQHREKSGIILYKLRIRITAFIKDELLLLRFFKRYFCYRSSLQLLFFQHSKRLGTISFVEKSVQRLYIFTCFYLARLTDILSACKSRILCLFENPCQWPVDCLLFVMQSTFKRLEIKV